MVTLKVLLVDDNPGLRGTIASFLKRQEGIDLIAEEENGLRAIEQAEKLHPDLVLMDLDMPECDGFKATIHIKSKLPNTRVVILSIHGGETYREMALRCAADGFIDKSSMKKDLLSAIFSTRDKDGWNQGASRG